MKWFVKWVEKHIVKGCWHDWVTKYDDIHFAGVGNWYVTHTYNRPLRNAENKLTALAI